MTEEIQSIEQQIAEAEERKAELQAQLKARQAAMRETFVAEVKMLASEVGMSIEDLIRELGWRKAVKPRQAVIDGRKPRQARVLKSDPTGPVYKGGAVPVWLADAMFGAGYSPKDKNRRAAFIAEHMQAA